MACTDPLPHWGPRCSRNHHSLHFCTAKGADLNRRWPFPVLMTRNSGSIESGHRTSRGCDDLWIFGHGHPASRGCIGPRAGYVLCQEQAHPPSGPRHQISHSDIKSRHQAWLLPDSGSAILGLYARHRCCQRREFCWQVARCKNRRRTVPLCRTDHHPDHGHIVPGERYLAARVLGQLRQLRLDG